MKKKKKQITLGYKYYYSSVSPNTNSGMYNIYIFHCPKFRVSCPHTLLVFSQEKHPKKRTKENQPKSTVWTHCAERERSCCFHMEYAIHATNTTTTTEIETPIQNCNVSSVQM